VRLLPALAALSLGLLATGCGVKAPEIAAVEWRVESRPFEGGEPYESLSVFGDLKDEEGLDNIVELWIVNDDSELSWKLTDADWVKATEGSDTWFGASALAQADFSALPRGSYRLVAIDAGGQRTEREFRVSGSFPDRKSPTVSLAGGTLAVRSDWPETLALAFDSAGTLISTPAAPSAGASLAVAFGSDVASRASELGVYGYDPATRMGSFSKRIKTR